MKTPEEVIDVALGEHQKAALAGNRDYVRGSDVTAALDAAGYVIVRRVVKEREPFVIEDDNAPNKESPPTD